MSYLTKIVRFLKENKIDLVALILASIIYILVISPFVIVVMMLIFNLKF